MGLQIALPASRRRTERDYLDILDGQETWLQRRLVRKGVARYEPETLATLLAVAHGVNGGAFIDVGAHFGFYAAVLERLAGERLSAVHAFEPTPETFDVGCRIRDANGLRFDYRRAAVSNETGEASLFLSSTAEVTNSLTEGFRRPRGTLTVPTVRLDDHVAETGIEPSILKIDVESHEIPALEGALGVIERHRPAMVVEVLERHHDAFVASPLWQRLAELSYRFYHIAPAVPWRAQRRNVLYPRSRDLLLVPRRLDGAFWQRYMAWRYAIAHCTTKLNRQVDPESAATAP